jgi:hypothetical protein
MKIFFLVMLIYPGWQTLSGPISKEDCLAEKTRQVASYLQTPGTPLIRFECLPNWSVPDKILWSF